MSEFSTKRFIDDCNRTDKRTYDILTFPTHERYETELAKTGHNFYSFHLPKSKKWNSEQIEPPSNYYILPESELCSYIKYDFILSQSKFWQFQVAKQIQSALKIPIISLEHTIPTPQTMPENTINSMRHMVGDINIFISDFSAKAWDINSNNIEIINHGINTKLFDNLNLDRQEYVLTVANDFINRDYCLNYEGWKRVTTGLETKLVGDTPGLSESASSTQELVEEYNKCGVYFNSSTLSPIPTSLLEAMSCGCPIVSTATCMIPDIIENGVNGFISNDENELRSKIEYLLYNKEVAISMGEKARETIKKIFSETEFLNKWNRVFDYTYRMQQL